MALGVPVLGSYEGAVAEVGAEAILGVDPYDAASIAVGIRELDKDDEVRWELSHAGKARAQLFSPSTYSDRLATIYQKFGLL